MRGTTMEDTDALHREQVVRRVGVVVDAAEERGRRILADELDDEVRTAGVLVDEGRDVVDEAGDEDERAGSGLLLDCEGG